MSNTIKYVPILKGKDGEFGALKETLPDTCKLIRPLIEFTSSNEDSEDKEIGAFVRKTMANWNTINPFFVDILAENYDKHSLSKLYAKLFTEFLGKNTAAIPVLNISNANAFLQSTTIFSEIIKNGVCLRITDLNIDRITQESVDAFLSAFKMLPENIDILIDFRYILEGQVNILKISLIEIINNLPYLNRWRTLTFASTGFPENLSEIERDTIAKIKRSDWMLWQLLKAANKLQRTPIYGDYAIANPDIIKIDPKMIKMSASIRYTSDESWVIVKGKNVKDHGFEQFHTLSEKLINTDDYCGENFSWGDKFISDCAARRTSTGNATTWRKVGTNHHIQKVITQLSN